MGSKERHVPSTSGADNTIEPGAISMPSMFTVLKTHFYPAIFAKPRSMQAKTLGQYSSFIAGMGGSMRT